MAFAKLAFAAVVAAAVVCQVSAVTYYIAPDGSGVDGRLGFGNCTTTGSPCATLGHVLSTAPDNDAQDTAVLMVGTHTLTEDLPTVAVEEGWVVAGAGSAAESTVDCAGFSGLNSLAAPLSVSGLTLHNCSAVNGGAISSTGDLTVSAAVFTNCHAQANGGAIYSASSLATLEDVEFSGCSADGSGGAVFIGMLASAQGVTASGNAAQGNGGALHISGGTPTVFEDLVLTDNSADGNGGAAFIDFDSTEIELGGPATITDNSAGGIGGGLYLEVPVSWDYTDVSVISNTAGLNENIGGTGADEASSVCNECGENETTCAYLQGCIDIPSSGDDGAASALAPSAAMAFALLLLAFAGFF